MEKNRKPSAGFTLLEILLVVALIVILAAIIFTLINPAESLKKTRDAQRISDLSSIKTAIGFYVTNTTTPQLAGTDNVACKTGNSGGGAGTYASGDMIWYSTPTTTAKITDATLDGGAANIPQPMQATTPALADGTGWIPVNLESLTGGSPLSNFPVDPVNTVSNLGAVASTDLVYRFACNSTNVTFEVDAQLESNSYTEAGNDKRTTDGGNNDSLYEVGSSLRLLGTGTDF
jgi:prepilin-type N-terminal cleavage/methylation domain-containing protein